MDVQRILEELNLEQAPSDSARARIVAALVEYGEVTQNAALVAAASSRMPKAHPTKPDAEWQRQYADAFRAVADIDQGVDPDDYRRFSGEYWSYLTDDQRAERLVNPILGRDDGAMDAKNLNEA